jgi:cytochrome c oxidase subunit II
VTTPPLQSALAPFGTEAARVLSLLGWMSVAGGLIFAGVIALLIVGVRRGGGLSHKAGMRLILWAGAVGPAILLLGLLIASLPMMRPIRAAPADLRVDARGEQFWWRFTYRPQGMAPVVSADALRLPVGRTVQINLGAGDVIHSFWVPGLAGKVDMIPGRTNRLVVRAERPGRFRGQCAEFCGLSHALMAFEVEAMEAAAFDRWLASEAVPARASPLPGKRLFAAHGCGGCHAVRGTEHAGVIGPDLTHVGGRHLIGAGVLPMGVPHLARFIREAPAVKPGARMPAYPQMPPAQAEAIARWLATLA